MELHFFYMDGCGVCDQVKPELAAFERAHPEIAVRRFEVVQTRWPKGAVWEPQFTPAYALIVPGKPVHVHEYPLDHARLEQWLAQVTQGPRARRRR